MVAFTGDPPHKPMKPFCRVILPSLLLSCLLLTSCAPEKEKALHLAGPAGHRAVSSFAGPRSPVPHRGARRVRPQPSRPLRPWSN